MRPAGLTAAIRAWASLRGAAAFTTAECFEQVKNADDPKDVADTLRVLWVKGDLARRKVAGGRFQYVWGRYAKEGFEFAPDTKAKAEPAPAKPVADVADTTVGDLPAAPEIPAFLRKAAPSPQPSPARGEGDNPAPDHIAAPGKKAKPAPLDKGGMGGFSSESIADAMLAKLKPLLQEQRARIESTLANHALESCDLLEANPSRITVRIKEIEITVEGVL